MGKRSLAATAAYQYQSADAEPIFVSGSLDETFQSIIVNIAVQALNRSKTDATKTLESASFNFRGFNLGKGSEISAINLGEQIKSIGDAAELLKQVAQRHSKKPAVVLDEFDAIPDQAERAKFASLIKQLGDQSIDIKFFITGIGHSCQELLGAHLSAHRQLATIELMGLSYDGRREIVQDAAKEFNLELDDNVNWRIAQISAGYPYYVHLLVEKMLWAAFDSNKTEPALGSEEFYDGLMVAVKETNAELRKPYEKAVLLRGPELEDIVWSTADGDDLLRHLDDMHFSYTKIISTREDRPNVDRTKYIETIRKLKSDAYGAILIPVKNRKGWYEFREKMLRGYVRMQAEANQVTLSGEKASPRQHMHIGNSRTGTYGSTIPKGVNQNKPFGKS